MTATYEKIGLKFLYPENWKLTDETEGGLPSSISLESPDGGGLWSVHVYELDADPDEILKETIITLQETYPDLEITPIKSNFDPHPSTAVETLFYCLDFLVLVRLQVVKTSDYQLLFWFQAEDREFEKQELVFNAMTISTLNKD
jgi:hypothetical protein